MKTVTEQLKKCMYCNRNLQLKYNKKEMTKHLFGSEETSFFRQRTIHKVYHKKLRGCFSAISKNLGGDFLRSEKNLGGVFLGLNFDWGLLLLSQKDGWWAVNS